MQCKEYDGHGPLSLISCISTPMNKMKSHPDYELSLVFLSDFAFKSDYIINQLLKYSKVYA